MKFSEVIIWLIVKLIKKVHNRVLRSCEVVQFPILLITYDVIRQIICLCEISLVYTGDSKLPTDKVSV